MYHVTVDFTKETGRIRPMHCVNNGPSCKNATDHGTSNFELYRELGIPYARNHDASFYARYGGAHTVDVHAVFPDFNADPTDPASYDFTCTDEYIKCTEDAGTHHFYRLGSRIEHEVKKYGTRVPPDFKKWAVICEHIIRHYTQGWADGYFYDMPYWEIWNEPDLDPDGTKDKRCWQGTAAEFYQLFRVTLEHLKACFPHLKIGGPAVAGLKQKEWFVRGLLDSLGEVKPDFFSWHIYFSEIGQMQEYISFARALLDEYGLQDCESILNEWNYVRGNCWSGPMLDYSVEVRTGPGPKCSAYTAAAMIAAQHAGLDMLMLYDARPSSWCSLFKPYHVTKPLKTYWALWMFNKLYRAQNEVACEVAGEDLYALAAQGEGIRWVMLTHYNDEDGTEAKSVSLCLKGLRAGERIRLSYYVIDESHSGELVREDELDASCFKTMLGLPLFATYLVKIERVK